MAKLTIAHESWPIAGSFSISRGSKTVADIVTVTLEEGGATGRGECVPYARYDETVPMTLAALASARSKIEAGIRRPEVFATVETYAARNALDCALWDLEAKQSGRRVWELAGLARPTPLVTAYTLSLGTPDAMAEAAAKASTRPLLKLKLGRDGDAERLRQIRAAAPNSRLIVDANEGWSPETLAGLLDICAEVGVELVEQPLPAANDGALKGLRSPVPICADESLHGHVQLSTLAQKYSAINIKLDKAGGLTEALALARQAQEAGLGIFVGCMLATSLAMAPAMLAAQFASVVDLDGPLLLKKDRDPGITYDGSLMQPAPPALWG